MIRSIVIVLCICVVVVEWHLFLVANCDLLHDSSSGKKWTKKQEINDLQNAPQIGGGGGKTNYVMAIVLSAAKEHNFKGKL